MHEEKKNTNSKSIRYCKFNHLKGDKDTSYSLWVIGHSKETFFFISISSCKCSYFFLFSWITHTPQIIAGHWILQFNFFRSWMDSSDEKRFYVLGFGCVDLLFNHLLHLSVMVDPFVWFYWLYIVHCTDWTWSQM